MGHQEPEKATPFQKKLASIPETRVFRITVHPEFSYSDFVGQILPKKTATGVTFDFEPGPFTKALAEAFSDTSKEVYLVVEELSRGNAAAIFGDIFQLLDRNQYFESRYPIKNKDIADQIPSLATDNIYLPGNFNIICTINTSDQNVFPIDNAFKRRFSWKYVSTLPAIDPTTNIINKHLNNPKIIIKYVDNMGAIKDLDTNWQSFYMALNRFITDSDKGLGKSEDKQVGQFFLEFENSDIVDSHSPIAAVSKPALDRVDSLIKDKLLMYLWNDVQGHSIYDAETGLFSSSIACFSDLYFDYGKKAVFSDSFINGFLLPDANKYPY